MNLDLLIPKEPESGDRWSWATVTQANPLRIRLDGESTPLAITPDCLIPPPLVGARVWVQLSGRRVIVIGQGTPDTGWIDLNFQNGWQHFDVRRAQYRRIGNRVQFRGLMKNGTVNAVAFSLPADARPVARLYSDHHWPVMSNGAIGMMGADGGNGNFLLMSGSSAWVDLSPITYLTD